MHWWEWLSDPQTGDYTAGDFPNLYTPQVRRETRGGRPPSLPSLVFVPLFFSVALRGYSAGDFPNLYTPQVGWGRGRLPPPVLVCDPWGGSDSCARYFCFEAF